MKDFRTVFFYYLKKEFRSTAFLVVTALMGISSFFSFFIVNSLGSSDDKEHLIVFDETGYVSNLLMESDLGQIFTSVKPDYSREIMDIPYDDLLAASDEEEEVYALISQEGASINIKIINPDIMSTEDVQSFAAVTKQLVKAYNVKELDISEELLAQIDTDVKVEVINPKASRDNFLLTYILYMIMVIVMVMYSTQAAQEVGYLKANKVMEILTTSTRPLPLYLGITLANGVSGLTQILVVIIMGSVSYQMNDITILNEMGVIINSTLITGMVFFVILFILGYVLYSFLNTASASLINNNSDLTMALLPVEALAMVQFFISLFALQSDGMVAIICSYIPFTAPSVMFVRYMMGYAGISHVIISTAILLITDGIIAVICSKLFTRGVVHYRTFKEFFSDKGKTA